MIGNCSTLRPTPRKNGVCSQAPRGRQATLDQARGLAKTLALLGKIPKLADPTTALGRDTAEAYAKDPAK